MVYGVGSRPPAQCSCCRYSCLPTGQTGVHPRPGALWPHQGEDQGYTPLNQELISMRHMHWQSYDRVLCVLQIPSLHYPSFTLSGEYYVPCMHVLQYAFSSCSIICVYWCTHDWFVSDVWREGASSSVDWRAEDHALMPYRLQNRRSRNKRQSKLTRKSYKRNDYCTR